MASYIQTTIHSKVAKYLTPHPDNKKPQPMALAPFAEAESTQESHPPIATDKDNSIWFEKSKLYPLHYSATQKQS